MIIIGNLTHYHDGEYPHQDIVTALLPESYCDCRRNLRKYANFLRRIQKRGVTLDNLETFRSEVPQFKLYHSETKEARRDYDSDEDKEYDGFL